MDTSEVIPKWFVIVWDGFALLVVGFSAVFLALQGNPASVLFVIVAVIFVAFMHLMIRGFRKRDWNFVELTSDVLRVTISVGFKPWRVDIPLSNLHGVELTSGHSFWRGFLGFWPYYPHGPHVDVMLRRPLFTIIGWGIKVAHLRVVEQERFAAELARRVST